MTGPNTAPMVLPPSPMTVGQALMATVEILKRRLGLFVALAFVPGFIIGAVLLVLTLVGVAAVAGAVAGWSRFGTTGNLPAALGLVLLLAVIGMLATAAIQIKTVGMLTLLAYETALGRRPDFAALNAGTRGIVQRSLLLILVAVAAAAVVTGVFLAAFASAMTAAVNGRDSSAAMGLLVLSVLLMPLVWVGWLYFATRWIYLTQGLAIEGHDGFAALANSWRLTSKDFWRTLGWYLLASLIVSVVVWLFSMTTGALLSPAMAAIDDGDSPFVGLAGVLAVLYTLLISALQALIGPASAIYITVMYIDQRRRNELTAAGVPLRFQGQPYPQQAQTGFVGPYPQQAQTGFVSPYPPAGTSYPPAPGFVGQYPPPTEAPGQFPPPDQRDVWGPPQTPPAGEQGDAPRA